MLSLKISYWTTLVAKEQFLSLQTGLRALFFLGLATIFLAGCERGTEEKKMSGATMGTNYHITLINPSSEINLLDLQQDIDIHLAGLNGIFSTYDEASELSKFNQSGINEWIVVSPELFEVITLAKQIGVQSSGAYDVTVGPLVELWGFGKRDVMAGIPPDQKSLRDAQAQICSACIELDPSESRIRKTRKLQIDLSSIAKGYAVDEVADILYRRHIDNYMVEIGGEVVTRGVNRDQKKWQLGIESPKSPLPLAEGEKIQQVIQLSGKAVATSGDYRNFMMINGKQYSHIIDPATGYPVEHNPASVTVIADNCALADGWATAFTVLGVEKSMEIAQDLNMAVYFISPNPDLTFNVAMTDAFKPYLESH